MSTAIADIAERRQQLTSPIVRPKWTTVAGAAQYVTKSEKYIRRLIEAGKITPYRPTGERGGILLSLDELDALIAASAR
jgi:excisionase family DNA binding protein